MLTARKLDLSTADGYASTEADLLVGALKEAELYKINLLYRGFDGKNLDVILEHGTDDLEVEGVYCVTEQELNEGGCEGLNPFDRAIECPIPAIAVYDGDKFYDGASELDRKFINPEDKLSALVAVYLLK